ncbi:MAG: iron ABC transporter permease [Candidatus Thermoplasmatota archaeon]|jgi:iron complex transport system permease protein|nr:iron ABC transporter permease [Candidatus Thermoplasmatota archaeon]
MMARVGRAIIFPGLLLLLLVSVALATAVGPVNIPLSNILKALLSPIPFLGPLVGEPPQWVGTVVWRLRLPVAAMALFVGAGLSVSGASMQGLFRNPLVDPFILGISAGGAFGWVVALILTRDLEGVPIYALRALFSFVFSLLAVIAAYTVAKVGGRLPLNNLLLAGIAVSATLTSVTQVMIYMFSETPSQLIFSLMGSCSNSLWEEVAIVAPVVLVGTVLLITFSRDINALSFGEEDARGLGVNVERSKAAVLGLSCLVSAVSIPFCGMIGFVGLIVPHAARKLLGPDNRTLLPASALLGASFLVLCDLISRSALEIALPLGMVTGVLGGGFFLYLLSVKRRVPS